MAAMILLVCLIKFSNMILFSVLVTFTSDAFPTVVRSIGYAFTLSCGRVSTFFVPFFINRISTFYLYKNPLFFLAPFAFGGFYLCFLMPKVDAMNDLIQEDL